MQTKIFCPLCDVTLTIYTFVTKSRKFISLIASLYQAPELTTKKAQSWAIPLSTKLQSSQSETFVIHAVQHHDQDST